MKASIWAWLGAGVAPAGGFGDFLSGGEGRQLRSLDISLASSQSPAVAPTSSSPCLPVAPASPWLTPAPTPHTPPCSLCFSHAMLRPASGPLNSLLSVPRTCHSAPSVLAGLGCLCSPQRGCHLSGLPGHRVAASPCSAVSSSHLPAEQLSNYTGSCLASWVCLAQSLAWRGPGSDRGKRQVQGSCPLVPERCQNQRSGAQRARLCQFCATARVWAGDCPSISLGLWVPGGLLEPRPPLVVLTWGSEKEFDGLMVIQRATPELGSW